MEPSRSTASADRLAAICGWLGVAAIVLGAWTASAGNLRGRRPLPEGVRSPILALELIRAGNVLPEIAPTGPEQRQLAKSIKIDFGFIAAYTLFFVAVGVFASAAAGRVGKRAAFVIVAAGIGAALFDVLENRAMLALLDHRAGPAPRVPSLWKWRLIFVAVLASVPVLIDRTARPFRQIVGYLGVVFAVAASLEGLVGT